MVLALQILVFENVTDQRHMTPLERCKSMGKKYYQKVEKIKHQIEKERKERSRHRPCGACG